MNQSILTKTMPECISGELKLNQSFWYGLSGISSILFDSQPFDQIIKNKVKVN